MAGGRVPVRGGVARGRLFWGIGIRSLEQYRSDNAPDLTWRDARNAHKQIRDAVKLYRLAHGGSKGTGPQTRTQIVEAVKRVKKNAVGVVRSGCKESWLDRLADALSVKVNLLADLHYAVRRQNIDIWSLRSKIDAGKFSDADLAAVNVLAEIEVDEVVPPRSHPDPPLTRLVRELTPIWRFVTGTSPYPKTDHRYGEKVCPFADWIAELIKAAGLRPPPENTVARLVRLQKSRK